jgi:hypothetical protein
VSRLYDAFDGAPRRPQPTRSRDRGPAIWLVGEEVLLRIVRVLRGFDGDKTFIYMYITIYIYNLIIYI